MTPAASNSSAATTRQGTTVPGSASKTCSGLGAPCRHDACGNLAVTLEPVQTQPSWGRREVQKRHHPTSIFFLHTALTLGWDGVKEKKCGPSGGNSPPQIPTSSAEEPKKVRSLGLERQITENRESPAPFHPALWFIRCKRAQRGKVARIADQDSCWGWRCWPPWARVFWGIAEVFQDVGGGAGRNQAQIGQRNFARACSTFGWTCPPMRFAQDLKRHGSIGVDMGAAIGSLPISTRKGTRFPTRLEARIRSCSSWTLFSRPTVKRPSRW